MQELVGGAPFANLVPGLALDETFTRTAAGLQGVVTEHLIADPLGNTVALTDDSGLVQTEYTYEPFGTVFATGVGSTNSFQFTSRENDGSGLHYFRARYYDSGFQRFISEDSARSVAGTNLFQYVDSNPVSYTDPLGFGKLKILARVFLKHSPGAKGNWAKFANKPDMRPLLKRTVDPKNLVKTEVKNGQTLSTYAKDWGRPVGVRGETVVEVAVNESGEIFHGMVRHSMPTIPLANIGPQIGTLIGVPFVGDVIDFFNPLSDAQAILDLIGEFAGRKR